MFIFGHRFIESEKFYHVSDIEAISNTPPSSHIYVDFSEENLDIIKHLRDNEIVFALDVKNITELIYASTLGASYIVVDKNLAKDANDIANNYLFDAKILVHIKKEEQIEDMAIIGVDGVIFTNSIVKINS
jgi:hypothetical protein